VCHTHFQVRYIAIGEAFVFFVISTFSFCKWRGMDMSMTLVSAHIQFLVRLPFPKKPSVGGVPKKTVA